MLSTIQAKLLIVDDLPENLLALEALIRREDRIVYKALSADEAQVATMPLAALATHQPDYILPMRGIGRLLVELEQIAC